MSSSSTIRFGVACSLICALFCAAALAFQQAQATAPLVPTPGQPVPETVLAAGATEIQIRAGLAAGLLGTLGRSAVPSDFLAWQLATGTFREPKEGDVLGPDDRQRTQTWTRVEAGTDGFIQNRALSGGYLVAVVNSDRPRTMILDASGYYMVRVNGEPRGGEKYGMDWVRHPVKLLKGRNTFLFQGERGRIRARLFDAPAPMFLTDSDATVPDIVVGEYEWPWSDAAWVGIRLVNATESLLSDIEVDYRLGDQTGTAKSGQSVAPMMTRKLPLQLQLSKAFPMPGPLTLTLNVRGKSGAKAVALPPFTMQMKAVDKSAHHVSTFFSAIDGSVQYYGVSPIAGGVAPKDGPRPALVLSLHGAGVEASGQARAYKPKDWAYVVTPTNRRPYGFDWEDWGRMDALEVLSAATGRFKTDPQRTYLTGHSMGGHGTWQVGVSEPDRWAAIAPSAGWRSFSTYGGGPTYQNPTPIEQMLIRANHPGETTELATNLLQYGVYILHGDKDDNVPVAQARFMRELLAKFHPDFAYYERPGAGHWWGDECVDWPPLFDFLKRHTRPTDAETTHVEFVTANPGASHRARWMSVEAQIHPLEYSKVSIDRDPKTNSFKGTTQNVSRLKLYVTPTGPLGAVELDGTKVVPELFVATSGGDTDSNRWVTLERDGEKGAWRSVADPLSRAQKTSDRPGGFKTAFTNQVVLVYGTGGTPEERARAFNKARFDAETFWYRGNGSLEVVADKAFDVGNRGGINVVLYGNADTNALWPKLLGDSPIDVRNGKMRIGSKELVGTDLGAYFIRPIAGASTSVGVVAWTGPAGWVAANPVQYFISGAGFPDVMIFGADMLRAGTAGVRMLGWFGNDWSLEKGEFAWSSVGSGPKH